MDPENSALPFTQAFRQGNSLPVMPAGRGPDLAPWLCPSSPSPLCHFLCSVAPWLVQCPGVTRALLPESLSHTDPTHSPLVWVGTSAYPPLVAVSTLQRVAHGKALYRLAVTGIHLKDLYPSLLAPTLRISDPAKSSVTQGGTRAV